MPLINLLVAGALAALPAAPHAAKEADPTPTVTALTQEDLGIFANSSHEQRDPYVSRPRPGRPSGGLGRRITYVLDPQLRIVGDATCVYVGRIEGDEGSALEVAGENRTQQLLTNYPLCANSPKAPAKPSPTAAAALAFEQIITLPKPTFDIPPGSSVAGMKAYMILTGPQTLDPGPINALGYTVTLHITSTYDIDWGDTTPTRTTKNITSQGGRGYPDGDIFHTYESKGIYTVTVTQHWTATYTITGAPSGTIADTLSTTSTMQLPVDAYQAVVTR